PVVAARHRRDEPAERLGELLRALPVFGRVRHAAPVVVVERLARPDGEGDRRREADGGDRNGSKASHRFFPAKKKGAGIAPRPLRWDRGTSPCLPTPVGGGRGGPPPSH